MSVESRLMQISYYNPTLEVRMSAYADTIVYEKEGNLLWLRAIRFGGYPEMVRGLSDALYTGANIDVRIKDTACFLNTPEKSLSRQLSHDGVYAEAVMLPLDDAEEAKKRASDDEGKPDEQDNTPPRKCFILCPAGDRDRLFDEIDRKTSVPLIPEFKDYILDTLERRGILKHLTVISLREKLDAWALICEKDDANIIQAVEDGLSNGDIQIPGDAANPHGMDKVSTVTEYLNTFGVTVAERIRNQFQPMFDPASEPLSPEVMSVNEYVREHAGYSLYDAQLAVAEAVMRKLAKSKSAFIVAECGVGKTKIGACAMAAVYALKAEQAGRGAKRKRTFNIVLCPSHVADKWAREIMETLPDTAGVVVRSITELDRLYALYEKGDKSVYAIISKERARDGYMKQPAVIWSRRRRAFLCPDCGQPVEVPVTDCGETYFENAGQTYFRTETSQNHKCKNCGSLLWTAVNPNKPSGDWVKIGGYGWVFRHLAWEHYEKTKNQAVLDKLYAISRDPEGYYPTTGACRRFPLSTYIKHRYRGKIDGLIVDELHEYNNDSGQGDAMEEIFSTAKKAIGMTATLINGYSSGIFYLLYRIASNLMQKDGKQYNDSAGFNREYGVVENMYRETDPDYASNRRKQRTKIRSRQLPGVSPLVFSRFFLEQTVFLSLMDIGKDLPDYEEIPVPLDLPADTHKEYRRMEEILKKVFKGDKKTANKILSAYMNLLTVYPDQPYGQPEIIHPLTGEALVTPNDTSGPDIPGEKEKAVLDIVRRKVENGGRVLVYTSWTRTDSQEKLRKLLSEAGFRAEIMTAKVSPSKREEWVQRRISEGVQVLITNPSLVETGLDLNAFTTLIFYSLGYKLFTLRQAAKRSWRINQTAPRVEVYLLYYRDTMQHKAIKLMASKLAVAGMIEGHFTDEGLAAMSDVQDMTSQMAKELVNGIKDNVEDVAAAFKKMAIINSHQQEEKPVEAVPEEAPKHSETLSVRPHRTIELKEAEVKEKRKRKAVVNKNQISLFENVA